MNVDLPYADGTITATLPPGTRRLSSEPAGALPPLADLDGAVRQALAAPLGLPRLRDLAKPGASVTTAFDDHTTGSLGRSARWRSARCSTSWPRPACRAGRCGWCARTHCTACAGRRS